MSSASKSFIYILNDGVSFISERFLNARLIQPRRTQTRQHINRLAAAVASFLISSSLCCLICRPCLCCFLLSVLIIWSVFVSQKVCLLMLAEIRSRADGLSVLTEATCSQLLDDHFLINKSSFDPDRLIRFFVLFLLQN